MIQPPLITYNLKERGRNYRGQERNFNINAICDSINSPVTQERVNTRAMLGYYGHMPRVLAGMEPTEAMVVSGKYNAIEPAIVTTKLSCSLDGTIEHQTEFLDNTAGRKAAALFANRIGGFSSAIDEKRPELFGFDYVFDPNYSTNRGFSLDSVEDSDLTFDSVFDAVQEEELQEHQFFIGMLEEKDKLIEDLRLSLDNVSAENEELTSMLASGKYEKQTLDSVSGALIIPTDATRKLEADAKRFKSESLIGFVDDKAAYSGGTRVDDIKGMMGIG